MRLIDADALLEKLNYQGKFCEDDQMYNLIINAPTFNQGEPVAYRHDVYVHGRHTDTWYDDIKNPASDTEITPLYSAPQSLQAHDNEVIEKCAKVCDELDYDYGWGCVAASTIRLMKGK